uniref:N-acetyltransferase domain-containing protein n=1 Tax=Acrobeloides nanus TaxID=290746 RepID=A0A914DR68_9BILA
MDHDKQFSIRTATPEDAAALISLIQELAIFEKYPDGPEINEDILANDLRRHACYAFIAFHGEELAGMALYYLGYSTWQGQYIHLEDLYVRPQFCGNGLGKKLIKAVAKLNAIDLTKEEGWLVYRFNEKGIETLARDVNEVDYYYDWQSVDCNSIKKVPNDPAVQNLLSEMNKDGSAFLPPDFYVSPTSDDYTQALEEIKSTFIHLNEDLYSPGHRFRAYISFYYNTTDCQFHKATTDFFQERSFNEVDGGKCREFDPLDETLFNNSIFKTLLKKNIELAQLYGNVEFDDTLLMQIHQIRYKPIGKEPAYATPTWLHRDDEPLTFCHLIETTPNIIGGDSVLSDGELCNQTVKYNITKVMKLVEPLDTLVVDQKPMHAVTPMGKRGNGEDDHRDIFLIDFKNNRPNSTPAPTPSNQLLG